MVALALVLTFTQCKKETEKPTAAEEKVFVTLTATYGQSGEKTDFTPGNGSFVWSNGEEEYIFVGGSLHEGNFGVLHGTGTGTGSMGFSGYLTSMPENGETLYFFYLGKGTTEENMSTPLDFSIQDGTLENLTNNHVAIGHTTFNGAFNFNVALSMAVSFAYFDISGFVNSSNEAETVRLYGNDVYSTATVNYQDGTITGSTKGNINLGTANAGKYVALIPSTTDLTTLKFDSNSKTGSITFLRGIQAGRYYVAQGGTALNVEATTDHVFSVSSTTTVRFAPGNLQYKSGEGWRFAEHQWGYIGAWDASDWVDLFGWGTWGRGGNPLNTSATNTEYTWTSDFDGTISNDNHTGWRTLTKDEWAYVFTTRTTTSGIKYAKAKVNDVCGVIILPDNWDSGTYPLNYANNGSVDYTTVADISDISETDWNNSFEPNGAVFLPAAGGRGTTNVSNVGSNGGYWSSTMKDSKSAYIATFSKTRLSTGGGRRAEPREIGALGPLRICLTDRNSIMKDVATGGLRVACLVITIEI